MIWDSKYALFFSCLFCRLYLLTPTFIIEPEKAARRETVLLFLYLWGFILLTTQTVLYCYAVCTVNLLILKTFAAARTVAPVSSMYSPGSSALSCVDSFIRSTPLKAYHTLSHRLIVLCLFKFPRQFELNNVLQFFEPANNIRGEAMIAAGTGIGVFPKRSGSVCHIAEKSDNIFENILLMACPH